jgi:flagellar basal body-associated protein FliL
MSEADAMRMPGRPDALAVYARRRARMVFLRRHVEEDHPVLTTEIQLISMARSKLMEDLLSEHGEAGLQDMKAEIVDRIRSIMRRNASSLISDASGRDQLFADIENEPLDNLFLPRSS